MIKKLFFLSFLLWHFSSQAQYIQSIRTMPAFPGPSDPVSLLIDLSFSSGTCEIYNETHSIVNDSIRIDVYHCPGPLPFICNVTDTIFLGALTVGSHYTKVVVHEKNYFSPDPCLGGHPADSSDYQLNVYFTSGINQHAISGSLVQYLPNLRSIQLVGENKHGVNLQLFNVLGNLVLEKKFDSTNLMRIPELASGIYMYKIIGEDNKAQTGKFLID